MIGEPKFEGLNKKENEGEKAEEELKELAEKMGVSVEVLASQIGSMVLQEVNKEFSKEYGFQFSSNELPEVFAGLKENRAKLLSTGYLNRIGDVKVNAIMVKNLEDVASGNIMGEELAHFYRCRLGPEEDTEFITSEFFGFLGRRLFEAAAQKSEVLSEYEDNRRNIRGKGEALVASKKLKEKIRSTKKILKEIKDLEKLLEKANLQNIDSPSEEMLEFIGYAENQRRDIIVHQRGYEWASKVDISKIKNWKNLFAMPNREVRKRFFTDEPDYSGL